MLISQRRTLLCPLSFQAYLSSITLQYPQRIHEVLLMYHTSQAANKPPPITSPPNPNNAYQTRTSGLAAQTTRHHSKPAELIFYGYGFCPFSQRIWIALEVKEIPYQYIETHIAHPAPPEMLEVNPEKRLPCIKHGNWAAWESVIVMEYVCDFDSSLDTWMGCVLIDV
jgi:Glutathione S-transferase, N-terminal domain